MRVMTFARYFPSYHPRKGEPTHFVEKIWKSFIGDCYALPREWHEHVRKYTLIANDEKPIDSLTTYLSVEPKYHTIRAGHRWKVGNKFSPRVWSMKPYQSKQIIIGPDIEVKKVWDIIFYENGIIAIGGRLFSEHKILARNDGLDFQDFNAWFPAGKKFTGQIICWNDKIEY